jgi:hypothetical protein
LNSVDTNEKLFKNQDYQLKDLQKQNLCLNADIKASDSRYDELNFEKDTIEHEYAKSLALNKQLSDIIRFRDR